MKLDDVDTVTVLGAGTMGHGIAEVIALAGYDVRLRDINEELVQDGYEQIEWSLDKLAERDHLSEEEREATLDRVTPMVDMAEAVADTDFLIEAVPERMDVKEEVYAEVEEHAPDRAVFASNTSSLSITALSEATDRPERFCGMHFFNPPVRMDLVEVIRGDHTADETLDLAEALAEDIGKTPIRVRKDIPGFIVNRILVPLMNEGAWLVESGEATIAEVDSTAKYDLGLPMGVFELLDQVGIDVPYDVLEYMHEAAGDAYEPCPLLKEKIESDHLGRKTGQGFYDYDDGGVEIPDDAGDEGIANRLLGIMANEVAKIVEMDVAPVTDIDTAVELGGGFPEGPAAMADDTGLDALLAALETAHEQTGAARYEPASALRERVERGETFYQQGDESVTFRTVAVERPREGVGTIRIDRPQALNSISGTVLEELPRAVEQLESAPDVRVVVLAGAGDSFCAGANVKELIEDEPLEALERSKEGKESFGSLEECPMPVVAGIDGYCLGGGMELAMYADIRIAETGATFGQPEHDLGLFPGWGGTQRLQYIVGEGRAKEIIFTTDHYDSETMLEYGFVNEVVEDAEARALDLAEQLASGPPIAQALTKEAMNEGRGNLEDGLEIESQAFAHLWTTDDLEEGLTAHLDSREPEFRGQ